MSLARDLSVVANPGADIVDINAQNGTTYTLVDADNDQVIEFNNASAITVTVPESLKVGFNCVCVQTGVGQVTFAAGGSATLNSLDDLLSITGQYGIVTVYRTSSNVYVLSGNLA